MKLHRMHTAAFMALAMVAAACEDQGPGSLSDPAAVTAELQAVDSVFGSATFQSYSELSWLITPTAGGALRNAAVVVEGSTPALRNDPTYVRGTKRADAWRQLVPQMAELSSGPIIPDLLYGTTFEWDVNTDTYVATSRTGAPSNGVRFILYAVSSITLTPVEPLVEVGLVDLMDESTLNSLRLHIRVQGVGGTPTYLDYTAAIVSNATSFTATVNGSLSNGLAGAALKTLTFNVSFQVTQSGVTENASYDLNNPSVSVDVYLRLTASQSGFTVSLDFRFARPGELVRLLATINFSGVGNVLTVTGTITVTVNDGIYARATATGDADPVWVRHDGSQLDAAELLALAGLFDAAGRFMLFTTDLLNPVNELIE